MMKFKRILCVCTGNICRSPLAEGYIRQQWRAATVSSAGIVAVVGGQMPAEAAAIADEQQLDLKDHQGRQISSDILASVDLVLVMERGQLDWLTQTFPEARGRVFLLSHWSGGHDIADPYRKNRVFFNEIYDQIKTSSDGWLGRIAR